MSARRSAPTPGRGHAYAAGKKTAEAIHQEVTREVKQVLRIVLAELRKTGLRDLESIEMAVRSAMQQAGGKTLTELLKFEAPPAVLRTTPCRCGQQAHYPGNCAPSRFLRRLAKQLSHALTTCARIANRASSPPMPSWMHLFVGSGVIEAGCKTVIGSRLKRSGMLGTVRGAYAILGLRCCHLNGRFEDYWERRQAA